ncbi:MAG TPA: DUF6797 domain-containing protein [Gemmataceae bacterium]|nr:DUF6797 domain-containing protein [Gemmataceae bacterium]
MTCRTVLAALLILQATRLFAAGESEPAESLEKQLLREGAVRLAKDARTKGDPVRGALLFHQSHLACVKCHLQEGKTRLGPDLARPVEKMSGEHLVEAVLQPSRFIRKNFETVNVVTKDGRTLNGLLAEEGPDTLVLRDTALGFKLLTIAKADIESRTVSSVSIMPSGLANLLVSRQQFLDLTRYLMEITEKGPVREEELRPLQTMIPLPAYERDLDHAGLIADLDAAAFKRGELIYQRTCVTCHGTKDKPGSLPTSLAFASGKFKSGGDPHAMYQTLTHGFGMMAPQAWMVPSQKYDVIHYIREAYVKRHNPSQYARVDAAYLAGLPKGKSRGPAPSSLEPWLAMDYGVSQFNTYEIGTTGNFAYKGIAVRLDPGPGGVARGGYWILYDHDTMRVAGAWSGRGFIDWQGIHFNGAHGVHPHTVGQLHFSTSGPGWANPTAGKAEDAFADVRLVGRNGKRYGPLPRSWTHYKGLHRFDNKAIVSYTVGGTSVLEMPSLAAAAPVPVFARIFNIGPRDRDMVLQVAHQSLPGSTLETSTPMKSMVAVFGPTKRAAPATHSKFDGKTHLEPAKARDFDLAGKDYSIAVRIKTKQAGTIFAQTAAGPKWVADGKALFVRGGRLCFDIGWVGLVTSRRNIADDRWHDVVMTWQKSTGQVSLYIDAALDQQGTLKPKEAPPGQVVRLGFAAPNFPAQSHFDGDMQDMRFYQRLLSAKEVSAGLDKLPADALVAHWKLNALKGPVIRDETGKGHDCRVVQGEGNSGREPGILIAGVGRPVEGMRWSTSADGNLRLVIPRGKEPLKLTLWQAQVQDRGDIAGVVASVPKDGIGMDLAPLTRGGGPRWPEELTTTATIGNTAGPFAVDVLSLPEANPWSCRMRLSGLDFYPDGDSAAVCSWDGDVWRVRGLKGLDAAAKAGRETAPITWRRMAAGLFQPLGLRIVDGQVYVSCRDQIVILRDRDGDGETDFYENFNNDHQVTDHFHEFAMDLQTDAAGNFYYARAARHALTALVPHHGTLLRVSKDGSRTDILATGFRAPNGVCLNPDGTFFLTDQEGHWTPKNRINWVQEGRFYGNMFGYHNVTDSSDAAMEQPVAWITNRFDRSPSELLWTPKNAWGPFGGSLLNLSYGYGKIFVVPHEKMSGKMQGGMVALPLPGFPTGVMRARFDPASGAMFVCGLNAWGSNQPQAGGLYRVRYTGQPVHLPLGLQAMRGGLTLCFSGPLDAKSVAALGNWRVKTWGLNRSAKYGSKHINEKELRVARAVLGADGKTVRLELPDIAPTWCMEVIYTLRGAAGEEVRGTLHNTIHELRMK